MQCSTLYHVQISINKWHTALLSTLCGEFWGTNIIAVPLSTNSGGTCPPRPPVIYAHANMLEIYDYLLRHGARVYIGLLPMPRAIVH